MSGSPVFNSPTPPPSPAEGNLWFNTVTGRTFDWYVTSSGGQWVEVMPTSPTVAPIPDPTIVPPGRPSVSPYDVTRTPNITVSAVAPSSPMTGDLWWSTIDGQQYVWYDDGNTTQWVLSNYGSGRQGPPGPPGSSASVTISPTPPLSPANGQLWWDSDGSPGGGTLYVWYNDGNSRQWVLAVPSTGMQSITAGAGIDLSGQSWSPTIALSSTYPVDAAYYGVSATSPDNTPALQAAVNAVQANGGGAVLLPAGNFTINGTINITANGVTIEGASKDATFLIFNNGSSDDFRVGFQSGKIYGTVFRNLRITHGSKLGGTAINLDRADDTTIDNVIVDAGYNCVYAQRFNNLTTIESKFIATQGHLGSYAFKIGSPTASSADRADVATFVNSIFECQLTGSDGLVWDGAVTTVRWLSGAITGANTSLHITNSFASNQFFPQSGFFAQLEIDTAITVGVAIEAGMEFIFLAPSWGVQTQSSTSGQRQLIVLPDSSASITRDLTIVGGSIGQGASLWECARISCENVRLSGTNFHGASYASVGHSPVVAFGADGPCSNVQMTGCFAGVEFGEAVNPTYGVVLNPGCQRISITGCDFHGCVTGGINDLSGNNTNTYTGNISNTGVLDSFVSGGGTFYGAVIGVTAAPGDNTTKLATTAFVQASLGGGGAPSGPAGGDLAGTYPNPTIAPSVNLTGSPTAPTIITGASTDTRIANVASIVNQMNAVLPLYAPISSPNFTGTPTMVNTPSGGSASAVANVGYVTGQFNSFATGFLPANYLALGGGALTGNLTISAGGLTVTGGIGLTGSMTASGSISSGGAGIYVGSGTVTPVALNGQASGDIASESGGRIGFSNNATNANTTMDVAISRVSAGVLEVNNGTRGTRATLDVGTLNFSGTLSSPGGIANGLFWNGWLYQTENLSGSAPVHAAGLAIGWNFSGGSGEVNYVNAGGGPHKFQILSGGVVGEAYIEAKGATFVTGANTNCVIAQATGAPSYNLISLNGDTTIAGATGFFAGQTGDPTMYMNVPAGGSYRWRINGTDALYFSATDFAPLVTNTTSLGDGSHLWTAVWATNGTIQTSDIRLKTEIAELPSVASLFEEIAPITYRWREGSDGRTHWGFDAAQIKDAFAKTGRDFGGHVVSEDGTNHLSPTELIPVLWKRMQEMQAEIDELRGRVTQ